MRFYDRLTHAVLRRPVELEQKCDKCKGPLAEGSLDDIWTDEDNEED